MFFGIYFASKGSSVVVTQASSGADFIGVSRKLAKEDGISMTAAMSKTAREDPDLHAAYVKSQQGKPFPR